MISKERIIELINKYIGDNEELFLVDVKIIQENIINVFVDTLKGITIDECVKISRHIENNLDRETEDFELQVSSPGLDMPLKIVKQYIKNVGRDLKITTNDGNEYKGKMTKAGNEGIEIKIIKITKSEGKKKKEEILISLNYHEIKTAKVLVSF